MASPPVRAVAFICHPETRSDAVHDVLKGVYFQVFAQQKFEVYFAHAK